MTSPDAYISVATREDKKSEGGKVSHVPKAVQPPEIIDPSQALPGHKRRRIQEDRYDA
ncbi:hypothetical protein ALP03_200249 [Pseudomonas amygdali pv. tabaci]|uniref:Uncharacterized protein n=1 Tax=Pseudomonas amygdali pv. tabaci TaxID=322 RepID=A0A3M6H4E6_PSEAJ|nr:hypothetical protein ALP03_200249 [Pseudomonas amygdali pv. tabaci]